jgi:cyclin D5
LAVRSLVVACLSLAAKMMEETKTRPDLSKLSDYQFEPEVTRKNVLIVLEVLEWKMTPITPFHYLRYFINKFCGEAKPEGLVFGVVQLIMAVAKGNNI